ncbi:MAG: tyrosinase family protein [Pirellulales bacterium]|nr:tyrosinase family protein [Pirellulales bacterium]
MITTSPRWGSAGRQRRLHVVALSRACALAAGALVAAGGVLLAGGGARGAEPPRRIARVPAPVTFERSPLSVALVEVSAVVRVEEARQRFGVRGEGLTAAVLDTGVRASHRDFALAAGSGSRVLAQQNYTADNNGAVDNAADGNGHGSNVAGIVAAGDRHVGMAPRAGLVAIKVLDNRGEGDFAAVDRALDWVLANRQRHRISVVNLSLSDSGNYATADDFAQVALRSKIRQLRGQNVAVVIAAGNAFFEHQSDEGLAYPAIFPEAISVGAVYDANIGRFAYQSGAIAESTDRDRITPFSQRLWRVDSAGAAVLGTDIFAPGAAVLSTGYTSDTASSTSQHGTSQAAPCIAGLVLLMQEYHVRQTARSAAEPGVLPSVDDLEAWLRRGSVPITDGDDEDDNVTNTGKVFRRVDAVLALTAVDNALREEQLRAGTDLASLPRVEAERAMARTARLVAYADHEPLEYTVVRRVAEASGGAPIVRKDCRDLTPDEIDKYREAFRRLQALEPRPNPLPGPIEARQLNPRSYTYWALIHTHTCPHGNWWFLPWHRAYLYYFEQALREVVADYRPDVSLAIPYWNWTEQRTIPELFQGTFQESNPLANDRRFFVGLDDESVGRATMCRVVDGAPDFISFGSEPARCLRPDGSAALALCLRERGNKSPLESGPHDAVHGLVGGIDSQGAPGDMAAVSTSAFDPIFWSHHANLDRLWNVWLSQSGAGHQNPDPNQPEGRAWRRLRFVELVEPQGQPILKFVAEIMDDPAIQGVTYQDFGPAPPPCEPTPVPAVAGASRGGVHGDKPGGHASEAGGAARVAASAAEPRTLAVARPAIYEFKSDAIREPLAAAGAAEGAPRQRLVAVVEGIGYPRQGPVVYARAYLNLPGANPETPIADPHYLGPFYFFGDGRSGEGAGGADHDHATFNVALPLTPAIKRLAKEKAFDPAQALSVTLVLVPLRNTAGHVVRDAAAAAAEVPVHAVSIEARAAP